MKKFSKDNLPNIYKKVDPNLVDKLNDILSRYSKENQTKFFDLIISFDKDYADVETIKYYLYLESIAKEPYADFNALEYYHNAMVDVNKKDDFERLYSLLTENEKVQDYIDDYMSENDIYYTDELYDIINDSIKWGGSRSAYRFLLDQMEDDPSSSTYSKINAHGDGFDTYDGMMGVFEEIYKYDYDVIDKIYFEKLDVESEI